MSNDCLFSAIIRIDKITIHHFILTVLSVTGLGIKTAVWVDFFLFFM